ncbi:hypothetical protein CYMTET_47989 [Cymbomonas tetramitiformis]|uniref:Tyrosine-protein kinase ephrin type A/B receptor-like domain-containing protein n=1 Tax=Cymbomonas tetramitiformis TaxID=36881 RepID=A0AAE0EW66_9CHLO|nr:hypothetical protein CYMTET_47989 [Cymbomonas tetramitiformis]
MVRAHMHPGVLTIGKTSRGYLTNYDSLQSADMVIDAMRWWSRAMSAKRIAEIYNLHLDPATHPDMILFMSFDEVRLVRGKQYIEDETGSGNNGFWGHWPGTKQALDFTDVGVQPITTPRLVASQADMYGRDIVRYIHPGEEVEIVLRGKDPAGGSLTTFIVSVPTSSSSIGGGTLRTLDGIELGAGDVVSIDSADSKLAPSVRYTAPSTRGAQEWSASFMYSVMTTLGQSVNATVIFHDHSSWAPQNKKYVTMEDTPVIIILGSVDMNGLPLTPRVTSLPEGALYQAVFTEPYYEDANFDNLTTPITEDELPITVTNPRGIVFYVPAPNEGSWNSTTTSFRYLWRFESGVESAEAACDVRVEPVNDPPTSFPQTILIEPHTESIAITLQQSDIDPTFATRAYCRVPTWPTLGALLQEDGTLIEEKEHVPTILQYVNNVPPFHQPTNTAAYSSQYSLCGLCCYTQENCTMREAECGTKCTDYSWHITQMIGAPDVYPRTEDSALGWDASCENCGQQYGVFEYTDAVYVTSIVLFETHAAGTVWKVSASNAWEGSDTNWTTLWQGEAGPRSGNKANTFTPPLCPEVQQFKYIRLDFDTSAVRGWNNHDAMALRGSFEFPPGQVSSPSGVVSYVPFDGIHSSDGLTPIDQFEYVASDCLTEEAHGATVELVLQPPSFGAGSLFAAARQTLQYHIGDQVEVDLRIEDSVSAISSEVGMNLTALLKELQVQIMAPNATNSSDFEKFQIQSLEEVPINLHDHAGHAIPQGVNDETHQVVRGAGSMQQASSDGPSGAYRVNIRNTDRSLDMITLHIWLTFPSTSITFRILVELSATCPDNITDPSQCASTASTCLDLPGSVYLPDFKLCTSSCQPGYAPQQGSSGDHSHEESGVNCTICPMGTFSNGGSDPCTPCSPGQYSMFEGSYTCLPCEAGEFMDEPGGIRCKLCDSGNYQEEFGQSECLPCPPGYFSDFPGQAECSTCASGFYSEQAGTVNCTACPQYTNNFQRANMVERNTTNPTTYYIPNSRLECLPVPGYYGVPGEDAKECPAEGGVCCTCPARSFTTLEEGLTKLKQINGFNYNDYCACVSGAIPYPYPRNGFMRSDEKGYEHRMVLCGLEDSCLGALAVETIMEIELITDLQSRAGMTSDIHQSRTAPYTSGRCDKGFTGRLCMRCETGFFATNDNCVRCPSGFWVKLGFTLSVVVAVVAAWIFLGVIMAGTFQSLSILLMYLQIGSMLQGFKLDWPNAVKEWAEVQTIVNFDVDLITPQCVIEDYGFEWSFYLQMLLPPIVLSFNLLLYAIGAWRIARRGDNLATRLHMIEKLSNDRISAVTSFAEVVYHSLCIRCFQCWMCDSKMGGELHFLVAAPDIQCWHGSHVIMVVVSVFAFFGYVIGIPVSFALILHYGQRHDLLVSDNFSEKFGFMYEAYELRWYWWTLMIFARRFGCAALLVFLASIPYLQATLALFLILTATVAHYFARPYVETSFDVMESTCLINLCFLVISGMVFYTIGPNGTTDSMPVTPWIIAFFIILGAQMSLGAAIFVTDMRANYTNKRAVKGVQGRLENAMVPYNARFKRYAAAVQSLGKDTEGLVSSGELWEAVQHVEDGLGERMRRENCHRMYRRAQRLQAFVLESAKPTGDKINASDGTEEIEIFSGEREKERERERMDVDSRPQVRTLLQVVAVDLLDVLIIRGMRQVVKLFKYVDHDASASVSINELRPLWNICIPQEIPNPLKELVLECFFLLDGHGGELKKAEVQRSLDDYNKGQTNMLKLMKARLEGESVQKIWDTVEAFLNFLIPEGSGGKQPTRRHSSQGASSLRRKASFRSLSSGVGAFRAVSLQINLAKVAVGHMVASAKREGQAFDASQCDGMVTILKPAVLQEFVQQEEEDGTFISFLELAEIVDDMSNSNNPQINIHGTKFESRFYNTVFDTFPYLLDWMLTASHQERKAALTFLESLCDFRKTNEANQVTCESMFKESYPAQIGYIWLKRSVQADGMFAKHVYRFFLLLWGQYVTIRGRHGKADERYSSHWRRLMLGVVVVPVVMVPGVVVVAVGVVVGGSGPAPAEGTARAGRGGGARGDAGPVGGRGGRGGRDGRRHLETLKEMQDRPRPSVRIGQGTSSDAVPNGRRGAHQQPANEVVAGNTFNGLHARGLNLAQRPEHRTVIDLGSPTASEAICSQETQMFPSGTQDQEAASDRHGLMGARVTCGERGLTALHTQVSEPDEIMAKSLVDDLINKAFGEACRRARQRKISKVQERITTREGTPVAAGDKTIRESGKRKQDRLLTSLQKQQTAHSSAIDLRVENKGSAKRRKFNDKQRAEVLHLLEDVEQDPSINNKMGHEVKQKNQTFGGTPTDLWQPVDQGYGREVKREMDVCQEDLLEDDHNLERWEDNKLTTSDKRVCLTHWLGESCETVNSTYNLFRYFQKGGLLMTVNGEGDGMITPEGTEGYTFPEPDLTPDAVEMLKSVAEEIGEEQAPPGILPERSDGEDEDPCDSDGGFVVQEQFRDPTDAKWKKALVGRSVMFFWEGAGWCKGVIKTVLTSSQQAKCAGNYEVLYEDGDKANNLLLHQTYSWGDEAEYGSWVLLQKALVEKDPKSTCTEVRAMPREQPHPQELDVHAEGSGEKFSADKAYAILKFDSGRVGDRRGCEHLSVLQ